MKYIITACDMLGFVFFLCLIATPFILETIGIWTSIVLIIVFGGLTAVCMYIHSKIKSTQDGNPWAQK